MGALYFKLGCFGVQSADRVKLAESSGLFPKELAIAPEITFTAC
jgi:hypothetical protein